MAKPIGGLRADTDYIKAVGNNEYLAKKYGGTPESWGAISTATMIGADLVDAMAEKTNADFSAETIDAKQQEVSNRADAAIASIFAKGESVKSAQKTAFVKSGVKLEGSALNVLTETANKAMNAATFKQQEAAYANTQMEVQKRMAERRSELAPLGFVANAGSSAVMSSL